MVKQKKGGKQQRPANKGNKENQESKENKEIGENPEVVTTASLRPGMVMAEDLVDHKTGSVLVKAGARINQSILSNLSFFSLKNAYYIYKDLGAELEEEPSTENEEEHVDRQAKKHEKYLEYKKKKEARQLEKSKEEVDPGKVPQFFETGKEIEMSKYMKPLPEEVSAYSQRIYEEGIKAIKGFYEKPEIVTAEQVNQSLRAAGEITEEIMRNHHVLLQIAAMKAFDNYTFSHAVHVAIYASTLAKYLNFSRRDMEQICLTGLLHDLGKIDIPLEILNKPEKLTPKEFEVMKGHVRQSYKRVKMFQRINEEIPGVIYQHHERMDGQGYPEGISGKDIHKWARIISIADVYDAVTTDRAYRHSFLPHIGAEILMSSMGQLDSDYVQAFLNNMPIYPIGSRVKLNTGEVGVVACTYPQMQLRPRVHVLNSKEEVIRTVNLNEDFTKHITEILLY